MNAKTLPTLVLLLAAASTAAAQQPHTPELVAPPVTNASGLVPRQLRPANRALAQKQQSTPNTAAASVTRINMGAPATNVAASATSQNSRVVVAVGQQQAPGAAAPAGTGNIRASFENAAPTEAEAEQPLPEPKFSLIPACPSVVPSQMLQLVDKQRREQADTKADLAGRLRDAADSEIFYYGADEGDMPPEPIPPGRPKQGALGNNKPGKGEPKKNEPAQTFDHPLHDDSYNGEACNGEACDGDCCDGCCDDCCDDCCDCCSSDFWRHRDTAFGELLVLETSGVDVRFAQRQPIAGGALIESVDEDFDAGYRVGFSRAVTDCVSLGASFAQFRSHTVASLAESNDDDRDVSSLVLFPTTAATGETTGFAEAFHDTDFQTVDVELSWLMAGGPQHAVNGIVGARYGQLEQNFLAHAAYGLPTEEVETATDIDFHGTGMRVGLDARRRAGQTPLSFYGKTFINVLFGEFSSEYVQNNYATDTVEALVRWNDERVVPVLECELGAVWTEGHWRLTSGYQAAFWFNSVTTPAFIDAVQANHFADVGETVTFHGLVTRLEFRY